MEAPSLAVHGRQGMGVSPDRGYSFSQSRQDRQDRPFHGIQNRFFRALRLGEKSSLPTPNRPSPFIGILPSCLRIFV